MTTPDNIEGSGSKEAPAMSLGASLSGKDSKIIPDHPINELMHSVGLAGRMDPLDFMEAVLDGMPNEVIGEVLMWEPQEPAATEAELEAIRNETSAESEVAANAIFRSALDAVTLERSKREPLPSESPNKIIADPADELMDIIGLPRDAKLDFWEAALEGLSDDALAQLAECELPEQNP